VLAADVVDDALMIVCDPEMGTVVVAEGTTVVVETGVVDGSVPVFEVLWGVPALVFIVIVGRPMSRR
jgi:hypothetical protein